MSLDTSTDSIMMRGSITSHPGTLTDCKCGCNRERDIASALSSLVVILEDVQYSSYNNARMESVVDKATTLIETTLLLSKEDYHTRYEFDWFSPHRIFQIYSLLFQNAVIAHCNTVVSKKFHDARVVLAALPTQRLIESSTKFVALYPRMSKPLFSNAEQYQRIAALFAYTVQSLMNTERLLSSFVPQLSLNEFRNHQHSSIRHFMGSHPALLCRVELKARKKGIQCLLDLVLINTVSSPSIFRLARMYLETHLADVCLIQFVLDVVTKGAENVVKHAHTLRRFGLLNLVVIELGSVFRALLSKRLFDPASTIGKKLGYSVELLTTIQSLNITLDPGSLKVDSTFDPAVHSTALIFRNSARYSHNRGLSAINYRSTLENYTCRRLNVLPHGIGNENSGIFEQRYETIEKPVYERLGHLFDPWTSVLSQNGEPLVERMSSFNRRHDSPRSASKMVDIQPLALPKSPFITDSNFLPLRPAPLPPMAVSPPLSIAASRSAGTSFLSFERSAAAMAARIAFAHSSKSQPTARPMDTDAPRKPRFRVWIRAILAYTRPNKRP